MNNFDDERLDRIEKVEVKGKRNVSEWNREKRKRSRVAGKEYVNTKGELIQPRRIGADCECRRKCYTKVDDKERKRLFDNYYSLTTHDEQNAHLFDFIRKHEIARRRSKGSEKRTCTFKYFVRIKNGKEIHICRQAFCHIHAISAHKVRLLCEKLDRNVSYPRDERGRHNNRPTRIPDNIISTIKNHVLLILESDRLADFVKDDKQPKNQTGSDLNITKMWRDFLNEHGNDSCYVERFSGSKTNSDKSCGSEASRNDANGNNRINDEWSGTTVKLWLYNKVFHGVASEGISAVLRRRIADIRNKRDGETSSFEVKPPASSTDKESVSSSQNLVTSLVQCQVPARRIHLSPSQTRMTNREQNLVSLPPVHISDQNSIPFQCGVASTLNIFEVESLGSGQYYR